MRRARIKSIITLPARRKVVVHDRGAELEEQTAANLPDKRTEEKVPINGIDTKMSNEVPTEVLLNIESTPVQVEQTKIENISVSKTVQTFSVTLSKEKEALESEISDKVNEPEIIINVHVISKFDSSQNSSKLSLENLSTKILPNHLCVLKSPTRRDESESVFKNSIQIPGTDACELEDDRIRSKTITAGHVINYSFWSAQSLNHKNSMSNIPKLNIGKQTEILVSECTRILSAANRELTKRGKKCPDKQKLTMDNLSYYYPHSNTIGHKPVTPESNATDHSTNSTHDKEKEVISTPPEICVPQVKVGSNGNLLIDEQSLEIDRCKAHENIDRSNIINNDTTENGFHKTYQKRKRWDRWETLKFYKALSTYGIDLSLIQNVFPNREREQLKSKLKKEEKINRKLIDKAISYQEFDSDALQKDLINIDELKREAESKIVKKTNKPSLKRNRKRCQMLSEEIDCEDDEQENMQMNENSCDSSHENPRITITYKKIKYA